VRIGRTMAASLCLNGTWPDLDYSERKRAGWPLLKHLNRVTSMASAWACPICTTHQDPQLLSATLVALRWWLQANPQDPNWYQMDIAVPREIGKTAVLLRNGSALTPSDAAAMLHMLLKANPAKESGANQVDMYRIQVMRGVWQGNQTLVADAFARTFEDVRYFPQGGDSFMRDHSFHQHGPQLLPAVYGAVIAADTMSLAGWAASTPAAMTETSQRVFEGYVLDGATNAFLEPFL
jgi:chondroitin AC lyase